MLVLIAFVYPCYRRVYGFRSVDELYKADSSCNYLGNINVPIVFINSKDDPLVHPSLLSIPENYVGKFT